MKKILIIILSALAVLSAANGEEFEYLDYSISSGADKYGPVATRESEVTYTKYFSKGANPRDAKALLGVQYRRNGVLVKRELYKKGKLHGVQKKWYPNEKIKTESPYREGIMHGDFKHWNENGQLIGQYKMRNGDGVITIFFDNGNLARVEFYKDNLKQGWYLEFYQNGNLKCINKMVHGKYIPKMNVAFHGSGKLYLMAMSDDQDHLKNGILIYFHEDDTLQEISYYLKGNKVNKAQYAAAQKKDETLPPLFANAPKYKETLSLEIKGLIEAYKTVEPVKIPLKFDDQGTIITKSGRPFVLPKK